MLLGMATQVPLMTSLSISHTRQSVLMTLFFGTIPLMTLSGILWITSHIGLNNPRSHSVVRGRITMNLKKLPFAQEELDFAGFTLTVTGIKPMQNMLNAILNFPTPKDITGARSCFGLVNQVAYMHFQWQM